jgi:pyruvate/2-oxoglutarate/acetoin dehydrogenase E1 component
MERIINYGDALREATDQEMGRDPSVIVLGIGIDDHREFYGTLKGLAEKYGRERIFGTPLAEDAMTGVAIGAALGGMRPIHVHERMDFVLLAMNQLVNIAAKSRYMYGGAVSIPLVVRACIGRSWGQGAQHSQALHSYFMHIPGLKVVAPTTPYDAKGCLVAAIRDHNPVIFMEHRLLHRYKGHVPEAPYGVPFGKARVMAEGADVTIVGISFMVVESLRARTYLESVGISAEVIDPVSLSPLDIDTICNSVRKTGRLLVVDSGWTACGASAEILAQVVERFEGDRDILVRRMGFAPVTCPTVKCLENQFYPNARTIAATAYSIVHRNKKVWKPDGQEAPEITEFKGPF